MSSPPNPIFDGNAPSGLEPPSSAPSPLAEKQPPIEDPVWTGWEVLALGAVTIFLAMFLFPLMVTLAARQWIYPQVPLMEIVRFPGLIVLSQLLAYLVILGFMYFIVRRDRTVDFWQAIRWNWPRSPGVYLLIGIILSVGLQAFAHLLPIPKSLPIDQFFRTTREAYILSIFGVTFAPLLEELFFRGFLYPVLARRLGMAVAVFLTALGFAAIHGAQLMYSWGPVLVIFMVGLALTLVRARTKSVAASLLIHIAYNGTISILMYIATDRFRHLEKLNQ